MESGQKIDALTVAGLALLLMPLGTMVHEIGGHASMCLATGGRLVELGAFYVNCDSPDAISRRIVAMSGVGIDAVLGLSLWQARRLLVSDLAKLAGWYSALCLLFSAAGYFLFSGFSGVGDLGPTASGGIGPLPHPEIWRVGFVLLGGMTYVWLIRSGIASLTGMIGQGLVTKPARVRIALVFYTVLCISAVLASLPNPVGLFVTLASAAAASFGGKAGMISIGLSARTGSDEPLPFQIDRNWWIVMTGVSATLAFAVILGPTVHFGS